MTERDPEGQWRRQPGRRYLTPTEDGGEFVLEYFPREDLPRGLTLTRYRQHQYADKIGGDVLVYESVGVTHDPSGFSVIKWGGALKTGGGRRKSGQALREARDWITKHRADLDAIDWTQPREAMIADSRARLLLGLPELETA